MSKIKVLEIGPGNFGKGGLSVMAWNWYEKFDYNKLKIDFLSAIIPDKKYIEYIKSNGGDFYNFSSNNNKIIKQFEKILFINKIAKSNKYDCIHIHASNAFETFIYYIACKSFCDNLIIHSHSAGMEFTSIKYSNKDKLKYLLHKIFRRLIRNKRIIRLACSDLAAEWMYPKKYNYTVIKNGIEVSKFVFNPKVRNKIRTELKIENKFVMGHIGRFSYVKNHDFLIDVFNEVYKRNQNAVLLLVGTGELENLIKDMVYSLGLYEAVIFYSTSDKANELYQAMDCFVFPSYFEGLGIVAIEAQAAGLKTLCSDVVPKEAQITDLLEYMPLSESAEKWARKILSYNNNYDRKDMSNEIKIAGYDIEQSAKQLERLYLQKYEVK